MALATFGISFAVVEIALRAFFLIPLCDESLHTRFRQQIPGIKPEVHYDRDVLGLRRGGTSSVGQRVTLRLLCLGASTTDQATQNWEDTWCGRLEEILTDLLAPQGVAIEAASYGRGAMTAGDAADALERLLPQYHPDVVVTQLGVNDVTWLRARPSDSGPPSAGAHNACRDMGTLLDRCAYVVSTCRLLRAALRREEQEAPDNPHTIEWHSENLPNIRKRFRRLPLLPELPSSPKALRWFSEAVERLVRLTSSADIPLVLLGQPVLWKGGMSPTELGRLWFPVRTENGLVRAAPEALEAEMDRFNGAQRAIAARHERVVFIDLEGKVPKDLLHFFDDCHYTDEGTHNLATAVVPELYNVLARRTPPATDQADPWVD